VHIRYSSSPNSVSFYDGVLQVVVACLSSEFVNEDCCTKLFYLAKSMQKVIQVVLLGANQNWMKTTDIGMQVSTEVCMLLFYQCLTYTHRIDFPSDLVCSLAFVLVLFLFFLFRHTIDSAFEYMLEPAY